MRTPLGTANAQPLHRRAEDAAAPAAELRVYRTDDAHWTWCYVEPAFNRRTVWAFNASTGNEEPYVYDGQEYDARTPTRRFEIFREVDGWEESHLGELYRSKYFTYNGIALHGSTFVPPYAASHGCVRVTIEAMDYIWQQELAPIGIGVWVYGSLPS